MLKSLIALTPASMGNSMFIAMIVVQEGRLEIRKKEAADKWNRVIDNGKN